MPTSELGVAPSRAHLSSVWWQSRYRQLNILKRFGVVHYRMPEVASELTLPSHKMSFLRVGGFSTAGSIRMLALHRHRSLCFCPLGVDGGPAGPVLSIPKGDIQKKITYFAAHKDAFDRTMTQLGTPTHSFNVGIPGMWPHETNRLMRQVLDKNQNGLVRAANALNAPLRPSRRA